MFKNFGAENIAAAKIGCSQSLSAAASAPTENMNFEDIKNGLANNEFILLDVRNQSEWNDGRIPGAKLLPLPDMLPSLDLTEEQFLAQYGFEKPAKEAFIVTYCRRGGRAYSACQTLTRNGYLNVKIYDGSWEDWVRKGGEVEK